MEVGRGPDMGCSAKGKKKKTKSTQMDRRIIHNSNRLISKDMNFKVENNNNQLVISI
jgi:hypothetical protein